MAFLVLDRLAPHKLLLLRVRQIYTWKLYLLQTLMIMKIIARYLLTFKCVPKTCKLFLRLLLLVLLKRRSLNGDVDLIIEAHIIGNSSWM